MYSHGKCNLVVFLLGICFLIMFFKYLATLHSVATGSSPLEVIFSPRETTTAPSIEKLRRTATISEAATRLPKSGELFCFVVTTQKYHKSRAQAVAETWLPRCDHGELFTNSSAELSETVPYRTVFSSLDDSYSKLFWKTKMSLYYTYKYVSSDFDWYLKADDDTYVIVENLRSYLSTLDPRKPFYIGFRMKPYLKKGYNSGGAGYVLSNEALRIFSEVLFQNQTLCPFDEFEDVAMGRCLSNAGIYPEVTVDKEGRQRFLPYDFVQVFDGMLSDEEAKTWFVEKPKTPGADIDPPSEWEPDQSAGHQLVQVEGVEEKVEGVNEENMILRRCS
uniref:N-acetylgalactosaminide beta-1,3-galactosyltransferase n=2 Tax=Steinernema glaseri TaxID=37863 RepID=A0A1I7Y357_9BILA